MPDQRASIRISLVRPEAPLLIETAAFAQWNRSATRPMSSLFALPSLAGDLTSASQFPSVSCTSALFRARALTLTRMMVTATDLCATLYRRPRLGLRVPEAAAPRRTPLRVADLLAPSGGNQGCPVRSSM